MMPDGINNPIADEASATEMPSRSSQFLRANPMAMKRTPANTPAEDLETRTPLPREPSSPPSSCGELMARRFPSTFTDVEREINTSLPSMRFIPIAVAFPVIVVLSITFMLAYGFSLRLAFDTQLETKFLSLVDLGAGTSSSSSYYKCEMKLETVDEVFRLDDAGVWSSKSRFSFMTSAVEVHFRAYEAENANYRHNMSTLSNALAAMNRDLEQMSADRALVRLVAARERLESNRAFYQTDADPQVLMDTMFYDLELWTGGTSCSWDDDALDDYFSMANSSIAIVEDSGANDLRIKIDEVLWESCVPNYRGPLSRGEMDRVDLRFNKHALWVAAAVNMGLLDVSGLSRVSSDSLPSGVAWDDDFELDDDDYAADAYYDDGDFANIGYGAGSSTSPTQRPTPRPTDVGQGSSDDQADDPAYHDDGGRRLRSREIIRARSTPKRRAREHRRRLGSSAGFGVETLNRTANSMMISLVSWKWLDQMDAIQCVLDVGDGSGGRCWLHANTGGSGEGLAVYPMFQHFDEACRTCARNSTCDDSTFDLDLVLLFDALAPSDHTFIPGNWTGDEHGLRDILASETAPVAGFVYSFYEGVKVRTHYVCTT